jgi:hypothetical protein
LCFLDFLVRFLFVRLPADQEKMNKGVGKGKPLIPSWSSLNPDNHGLFELEAGASIKAFQKRHSELGLNTA